MEPITCPWCKTVYQEHQPNCTNCGGMLPMRDGLSAGPPPPPPPRELPAEFTRRADKASTFELLFGSIFGGVGGLLGVIFVIVGIASFIWLFVLLGVIFGAVFGGIGAAVLLSGRRRSRRLLQVLREGVAVTGTVDDVAVDYTVRVNHRHPWRVSYSFVADGVRHAGSGRAWTADSTLQRGVPVHVVYLATQPARNSIYPPLA